MKRYGALIAAIVFVFAGLLILKAVLNSALTDEEMIKSVIVAIADAAEERRVRGISQHLSEGFRAEEVNFDRDSAIATMQHAFLVYKSIQVEVKNMSVKKLNDDTAEATLLASVFASQSADTRGEDMMRYLGGGRLLVTLKKIDGKWLVTRTAAVESTAD
ncbi:MAG TPA: hypothetical protein VM141_08650 [Planctomycetota bacterium]|nr:hypothetical protein [Planctomycetota bacterium]